MASDPSQDMYPKEMCPTDMCPADMCPTSPSSQTTTATAISETVSSFINQSASAGDSRSDLDSSEVIRILKEVPGIQMNNTSLECDSPGESAKHQTSIHQSCFYQYSPHENSHQQIHQTKTSHRKQPTRYRNFIDKSFSPATSQTSSPQNSTRSIRNSSPYDSTNQIRTSKHKQRNAQNTLLFYSTPLNSRSRQHPSDLSDNLMDLDKIDGIFQDLESDISSLDGHFSGINVHFSSSDVVTPKSNHTNSPRVLNTSRRRSPYASSSGQKNVGNAPRTRYHGYRTINAPHSVIEPEDFADLTPDDYSGTERYVSYELEETDEEKRQGEARWYIDTDEDDEEEDEEDEDTDEEEGEGDDEAEGYNRGVDKFKRAMKQKRGR